MSLGRSTQRQTVLLVGGAAVPALLYLIYVFHYSVNVPIADDWNVIGLASAAIHHQLTLHELWAQYGDTRLFISFLFLVAFGVLDHLNEKSIILCSAAVFIVTFVLLLRMFKAYLGRRLTLLPVVSLGIVWFSLADVQNSLWSFQLAWYFVIFAFVAIAYLFLIPGRHRNWFFALGVVLAAAASLAEVQGFVVWSVGLICILWASPWGRRTYLKTAIWVSAAVLTTGIYLHGFSFAMDTNICVIEGGARGRCSLTFGLLHPTKLANFFIVLVGNVVPTTQGRFILVHQLLGAAICIAACFVVIQSIRERPRQASPLPLLLIVFALVVRPCPRPFSAGGRTVGGGTRPIHDAQSHLARRHRHLCMGAPSALDRGTKSGAVAGPSQGPGVDRVGCFSRGAKRRGHAVRDLQRLRNGGDECEDSSGRGQSGPATPCRARLLFHIRSGRTTFVRLKKSATSRHRGQFESL